MTSQTEKKPPYRIGLSLSGGGARGFAHLGAIKALEEKGIHPNIISGTSAGALAAVLYADGKSPDEILSLFVKKGFKEFAELSIPHAGIFKTDRFKQFLKDHLSAKNFDQLNTPLKVITTDIVEGISVIFDKGSIIRPVMASCAYPIVFPPIQIKDEHYIDGGLFMNFPVTAIRNQCETVIGVNVCKLTKQDYKNSLLYVAERTFHYMSVANSLKDRDLCDILIEPEDLSNFAMFTLDHIDEIFDIGYKNAKEELEKNKNINLIEKITQPQQNQA